MKVKDLIQWIIVNFFNQAQFDNYRPKLKNKNGGVDSIGDIRDNMQREKNRAAIFPLVIRSVFFVHTRRTKRSLAHQ